MEASKTGCGYLVRFCGQFSDGTQPSRCGSKQTFARPGPEWGRKWKDSVASVIDMRPWPSGLIWEENDTGRKVTNWEQREESRVWRS